MNNACIIGFGTVGRATAQALGIEKYYSRSESNITLADAAKCEFIFICLPTPTVEGRNYTDDIFEVISKINEFPNENDRIFIIRSTVYPGFNRFVQKSLRIDNVVSNPEFLSEDTAVEDAKHPDYIVIGGDLDRYRKRVEALYKGRFRNAQYVVTDTATAELLKYSLNLFFTTKVIFANEIFDFAEKLDANYGVIQKVLEKHKWGSRNHFEIYYKGRRGVHGKCLPKDTEAFAELSGSKLFKILVDINRQYE